MSSGSPRRPAPEVLTTARLLGVPLEAALTDERNAVWADERVTATLATARPHKSTRECATTKVSGPRTASASGPGEIGRPVRSPVAPYWNASSNGTEEVEVTYAFVAQRWGQGLDSEAAREIIGVAFEEVGLRDVVSFTRPTNRGSRNVMEKAGRSTTRT